MYSWKPKAFSYGRRWIVGFRYIYFHERVIENQDFPDRLEIFWSFTRSIQPMGHLNFYYRAHVQFISTLKMLLKIKKFHNSANFYLASFAGGCRFIKRGLRFRSGDNE